MGVRGTSGKSASVAWRGGRSQAPGTAARRGNNSASEKNAHRKIMISFRNSAIAMRCDLASSLGRGGWLACSRPCDIDDGPASALVSRKGSSRAESLAICGRRERGTAREREKSVPGMKTM